MRQRISGSITLPQGTGSLDGETSGSCSGNTIKVKIIDACASFCLCIPSYHATSHPTQLPGHTPRELLQDCSVRRRKPCSIRFNQTWILIFSQNIRPQEACEASGVNALDIATTARSSLSSFVRVLSITSKAQDWQSTSSKEIWTSTSSQLLAERCRDFAALIGDSFLGFENMKRIGDCWLYQIVSLTVYHIQIFKLLSNGSIWKDAPIMHHGWHQLIDTFLLILRYLKR